MPRRKSKRNEKVSSKKSQKGLKMSARKPKDRKVIIRCQSCEKTFKEIQKYKQHLKSHKPRKCRICEPRSRGKELLTKHRTKRSKKHIHCKICKFRFATRNHLDTHSKCHKWKRQRNCTRCSRQYFSMLALLFHMKSHAEEKCGDCGKVFSTAQILKIHACQEGESQAEKNDKNLPIIIMEVTGHGLDKTDPEMQGKRPQSSAKKHVCQICRKSFSSASCRSRHQRVHTREKRYKCEDCEEKFSERALLVAHMVKHTGIPLPRKFVCDVCGKGFTRSTILSVHKRTHGSKNFKCERCEKAFSHQKILDRHMTTHDGDRQYPCEYCVKKFLIKSNLKRHMLVHTGEKPFKCQKCDKTFSQAVNLKTHERVHSGERPFTCDVCGKSFAQKVNLKHHIHVHACDILLQCEYCDQAFTVPSNLQNHVESHLQPIHREREMPDVEFQEVEVSTVEEQENTDNDTVVSTQSYDRQAAQRDVHDIMGTVPNTEQVLNSSQHPRAESYSISLNQRAPSVSNIPEPLQVSETVIPDRMQPMPGPSTVEQSTIDLSAMQTFGQNLQHHPESNLLLVAELAYRQHEYDLANRAQNAVAQPNTIPALGNQFGHDANTLTNNATTVFQLQTATEKNNSDMGVPSVPFATQHILLPAVQARSVLQTPVGSSIRFESTNHQNSSTPVELGNAATNIAPLCSNVAYVIQAPHVSQPHTATPVGQPGQVQRVQCSRCSQVLDNHYEFFEHSKICT